jgi:kynurenine formamidase
LPDARFIDLSHTIEHGMITHPGLPGPVICDYLSREASRGRYGPGVEFQIGRIEMVANTGTYIDSPFHRYRDGKDLAALGLGRLVDLPAVVVRAPAGGGRVVQRSSFAGLALRGAAVLVHTGWDAHWRTPRYGIDNPHLTGEAAAFLVEEGVALVGIDAVNIDDLADGSRPVHSTLLGAEVPIVEHLTGLAAVPDRGARFSAVPPKLAGVGSWPVRAYVVVKSER